MELPGGAATSVRRRRGRGASVGDVLGRAGRRGESWAALERVLGRHNERERGEGSGPGFGLGRDLGLSWVLGSFSISKF